MSQGVVTTFILAIFTSLQLSTNASRSLLALSTAVNSSHSTDLLSANNKLHDHTSTLSASPEHNADDFHGRTEEIIVSEYVEMSPVQEHNISASFDHAAIVPDQMNNQVSDTNFLSDLEQSVQKGEAMNSAMFGAGVASRKEMAAEDVKQLQKNVSVEKKKKGVGFSNLSRSPPSGPNPGGNSSPSKKLRIQNKLLHNSDPVAKREFSSTFRTRLTPNPGSGPRPGGN